MNKEEYIKNWLLKANEDVAVIEDLMAHHPENYTGAICFHCQQAVEKYLKALLIHRNIDFPKTHDLDFLLNLCSSNDTELKQIELLSLTDFGVSVRYPDDFYIPEIEEAKQYFEIAQTVKEIIQKIIVF